MTSTSVPSSTTPASAASRPRRSAPLPAIGPASFCAVTAPPSFALRELPRHNSPSARDADILAEFGDDRLELVGRVPGVVDKEFVRHLVPGLFCNRALILEADARWRAATLLPVRVAVDGEGIFLIKLRGIGMRRLGRNGLSRHRANARLR